MALTYKQRAFVEHFLGDAHWNATEAARRTGYKHPHQMGAQNLSKLYIRERIVDRLREMGASAEMLIGRWLQRIEADVSQYLTPHADLDLEALKAAGLGFMIKGIRRTRNSVHYELRDQDKAEEMLAKHLGMFIERREHSGKIEATVKVIGGVDLDEL